MAQPDFYAEGTTPLENDTRLRLWVKILGRIQNRPGANPANNPNPHDTLAIIKRKIVTALGG